MIVYKYVKDFETLYFILASSEKQNTFVYKYFPTNKRKYGFFETVFESSLPYDLKTKGKPITKLSAYMKKNIFDVIFTFDHKSIGFKALTYAIIN